MVDSEDVRVGISELLEDPKNLSLGDIVRSVVRLELMLEYIKRDPRFIQDDPNLISVSETLQGKLNIYYREFDDRERKYLEKNS